MSLHIQLNIQTITDEMMALTALRSVTAPGGAASSPLLTRDQLPALRVVARMVFADILLTLGGAVEKSSIDGEDGGEALPYDESQPMALEVTFRTAAEPAAGMPLLGSGNWSMPLPPGCSDGWRRRPMPRLPCIWRLSAMRPQRQCRPS